MISDEFSLVVVPAPILDESVASWLMRLCQMHAISPDQLFRLTHLKKVSDFDRDIQLADLEKMAHGTGLGLGKLQCLIGKFQHLRTQAMWTTFATGSGSQGGYYKYCPHCLASDEDPYWRFTWRLTYYKLCPVHEIELADRCPSCYQRPCPVRGPDGLFVLGASVLCVCQFCGCDWRNTVIKPTGEKGLHSVLALQRTITAAVLCGHFFVEGLDGKFPLTQLHVGLRKGMAPVEGDWEGYSPRAIAMRAIIAGVWDIVD